MAVAASTKNDSPKVNFNVDKVSRETSAEPYFAIIGGRRVPMADITDIDWQMLERAATDAGRFLKAIIPADDWSHFVDQHYKVWQIRALIADYQAHYGYSPGGLIRLAAILSRFGADIEADLHRIYRLDLADLLARRRLRLLLNLIEHLPGSSFYVEAVSLDEEMTRYSLENAASGGDDEDERPRRMAEWNATVDLLARIHDQLTLANRIAITGVTGKPASGQFKPIPRPVTAREKVQEQLAQAQHQMIIDKFAPRSRLSNAEIAARFADPLDGAPEKR